MGEKKEQEILQDFQIDGLLLTSSPNMFFVAGFTGEGYVYISRNRKVIVTDSRYTIATKKECPEYDVYERGKEGYYEKLLSCVREDQVKTLGFEDEVMTVNSYEKIQKEFSGQGMSDITLVPMKHKVSAMRSVKTEQEIEKIRLAEAIGDRAFSKILTKLKPGMTEKQVAAWLEFFMKEEGAEGFSFETIAASGIHSAMPHGVPTDKVLEQGDFLTMDFGCVYQGYCSDMTRTVVIGTASDRQRAVYETVLRAQERALQKIRPGLSGKEIDAFARDLIVEEGYGKYFGHALGHSVGIEIHESPNFSPVEETVIQEGMVITVEPGIYIEDFGGVRIEDVIVVTKDGCENITHSPKELIEIICEE